MTIFVDGLGSLVPPGVTGMVQTAGATVPLTAEFFVTQGLGSPPLPSFVTANPLVGAIAGLYEFHVQVPAGLVNSEVSIGSNIAEGTVAIAVSH